jgi:hypothetical protein
VCASSALTGRWASVPSPCRDHPTISRKDGEYIFGRLDKGALSATFPATFRSVRDTKEGGHPGSYSSYGPSWRLMGRCASSAAHDGPSAEHHMTVKQP